jgi:hypothetical protein
LKKHLQLGKDCGIIQMYETTRKEHTL